MFRTLILASCLVITNAPANAGQVGLKTWVFQNAESYNQATACLDKAEIRYAIIDTGPQAVTARIGVPWNGRSAVTEHQKQRARACLPDAHT